MKETWKCVIDWLCQVGAIKNPFEKFPSLTMDMFLVCLRDGEIFVRLINILLDRNIIPYAGRNSYYAVEQNIEIFRAEASRNFELKDDELFTAHDLLQAIGVHKIFDTLSAISKHPLAINKGGKSFTISRSDNDYVYDNIATNINSLVYDMDYSIIDQVKANEVVEENIYDIILTIGNANPAEELAQFNPVTEFDFAIKELVESETNYVNLLESLMKIKIHLMSFLPENDLNIIFVRIEELNSLHKCMLTRMLAELRRKEISLGPIISRNKTEFLCYGDFMLGLKAAQNKAKDIQRNDVYTESLKSVLNEYNLNGNLDAILTLIFQRFFRYSMMYERLLKEMPNNYPDRAAVQDAIAILKNLADHVNKLEHDKENKAIIEHLEKEIGRDQLSCSIPNLYDVGRRIHDEDVKVIINNDTKRKYRCRLFLMETVLIAFKKSENFFYPRISLDYTQFHLEHLVQKEKSKYGWILKCEQGDETELYTFKVKSKQSEIYWIKIIQEYFKIRNATTLNKSHSISLETVKIGSICSFCGLFLGGSFAQSFTCSACLGMYHEACVQKAPACQQLKHSSSISQRSSITSSCNLRSRLNTHSSSVSKSSQSQAKWFDPKLNRQAAEALILKGIEGSFIIRGPSVADVEAPYVLSFMYDKKVRHMKVYHVDNLYYLCPTKRFDSLDAMIFYYQTHSIGEIIKAFPTMLKLPAKGPLYTVIASKNYPTPAEDEISFVKGDQFRVLNEANDRFYAMNILGICGFVPKNKVQMLRH